MLQEAIYGVSRPLIGLYGRILSLNVLQHAALPEGPKIIIANHPTTSDPFLVAFVAHEPARMLITGHAFNVPVFGTYLRKSGHIPVVPGDGHRAFETAEAHLAGGGTLIIFPEGDLSPREGGFKAPRTGAARLALLTGVPVIPMGISLSPQGIWNLRRDIKETAVTIRWARRGPYGLTVGHPLRFGGDVEDHDYVKWVARRMMQHVMDLAHESRERLQTTRFPIPDLWPSILEPVASA
jgi:1-acyl-sn-glycerol-3-phosphate acyltransferase